MATERLQVVVDEKGSRTVKRRINDIGKSAKGAEGSVSLLRRALGLLGGALAAREFLRFVDTAQNIENRLKTVTRNTRELTQAQDELFEIAQRTRTAYESTVEIFARVGLAAKDLGVSQAELLKFTESLNQAVVLSGASAEEANAAMIQLSQGIASGTLRGDELRSVLEQLPVVADVIAKSLGVTRGELRDMGAEGKITADIVLRAFAEARQELDEKFGKATATVGQRFTQLRNSTIKFVGELDDAIGITRFLGAALKFLADNLALVIGALAAAFGPAVISALVTRLAVLRAAVLSVALVGPIGAMGAAFKAMAAAVAGALGPVGLAAVGITAVVVAVDRLTPRVADLTEQFDPALTEALSKASPAFRAMANVADDATESLRKLSEAGELAQVTIFNFDEAAARFRTLEERAAAAGVSVDEYRERLRRSRDALERVRNAITLMDIELNKSNENFKEAAKAIEQIESAIETSTEQLNKHKASIAGARREYERLVSNVESLRKALDPVVEAQLEFRDTELLLTQARAQGLITQEQQVDLLNKQRKALEENLTVQQRIAAFGGVQAGGFETFETGGPSLGGLLDSSITAARKQQEENREAAAEALEKQGRALAKFRQSMDSVAAGQPGLSSALDTIRADITDVGTATEKTLVNAFRGAENALVQFVQTGKLEFSSLVDSILADLTRLLLRQAFFELLGNPGGAASSAGGLGGAVGSLIGSLPGAAHGADFVVPGSGAPDSRVLAMRVSPKERIIAIPPNQQTQAQQAPPQQAPQVNVEVRLSSEELRSVVLTSDGGRRALLDVLAENPNAVRSVTGGG